VSMYVRSGPTQEVATTLPPRRPGPNPIAGVSTPPRHEAARTREVTLKRVAAVVLVGLIGVVVLTMTGLWAPIALPLVVGGLWWLFARRPPLRPRVRRPGAPPLNKETQ